MKTNRLFTRSILARGLALACLICAFVALTHLGAIAAATSLRRRQVIGLLLLIFLPTSIAVFVFSLEPAASGRETQIAVLDKKDGHFRAVQISLLTLLALGFVNIKWISDHTNLDRNLIFLICALTMGAVVMAIGVQKKK